MMKDSLAIPLLAFTLLCGCQTKETANIPAAQSLPGPTAKNVTKHRPLYVVRAGSPDSFVGLETMPASNLVSIFPAREGPEVRLFRLTNGEPHAILLWNVRVQVRSVGRGTDGQGWDTVHDDYPSGPHDAKFQPGDSGHFKVITPSDSPWRVCVLYSIDYTDSGKSFYGNYEAVSAEQQQ